VIVHLTEPQAEFTFSDHPFPSFFAGFGAGKSFAATLRLVHLVTQDPGIDVSHFFPLTALLSGVGYMAQPNIYINLA